MVRINHMFNAVDIHISDA
ncbi:TPA: hypothetical protein ACIUK6_004410 [Salmonella enterica subsp. enterica serovar Rough:g,s,t:-]